MHACRDSFHMALSLNILALGYPLPPKLRTRSLAPNKPRCEHILFSFAHQSVSRDFRSARQSRNSAISSGRLRLGAARLAHSATRTDPSPRETALIERYGEVCTLDEVAAILKYPSGVAVRRAHALKRLPLPLTRFTGRRGLFALTRDIARLLDAQERPFVVQPAAEVR